MNCTVCNHKGAEIGLSKVYCPNLQCKWYDAEQAVKYRAESQKDTTEDTTGEFYYHDIYISGASGGLTMPASQANPILPTTPSDGDQYYSAATTRCYYFRDGEWEEL